jgi:hypothetical protein
MTVKELIAELNKMPQDMKVFHLWDGEPRTAINLVWEARGGFVMTSDFGESCYSDKARPKDAPTEEEDRYWETIKNPLGYWNNDDDINY